MMEHNVLVNGIEVNAVYSERAVNELFIPLLKKLSDMQLTVDSNGDYGFGGVDTWEGDVEKGE